MHPLPSNAVLPANFLRKDIELYSLSLGSISYDEIPPPSLPLSVTFDHPLCLLRACFLLPFSSAFRKQATFSYLNELD